MLAAIVGLSLTACLLVLMAPSEESLQGHQWVISNLSSTEARTVRRLAEQIARANGLKRANQNADRSSNVDHSPMLTEQATALSIRLSAALAVLLRTEWGIDPVPWVRLAAKREQTARRNIEQRLLKFEYREREFPGIQITVRGPKWLHAECGEDLFSEVTGVGFWQFHDSDIPAKTQFSDSDVSLLLDLPGLERIWAENSQLSDTGLLQLTSLPRLTDFHLAGCERLTDKALGSLRPSTLRVLDVSGVSLITDAGIRSLHSCSRLQELGLSQTGVTSDSIPVISKLYLLNVLKLDKTAIVSGLEQLETLHQLEVLNLSHLGSTLHPIPPSSLNFLTRLSHLRVLDLSETAVDRILLINLPHLEHLSVGHESLRKITLRKLPRVREVVTGYPSTRTDIRLESVELNDLEQLSLLKLHVHDQLACTEFASGLTTLPALESVYLPVAQMSDPLAEELGRLPQLQNLIIEHADLSDQQIRLILNSESLRRLDCGGQSLTSPAVQLLLQCDHMERLKLKRLRFSGEISWKTSDSLKELSLLDCDIQNLELSRAASLNLFDIFESRFDHLEIQNCPQLARTQFLQSHIQTFEVQDCQELASIFAGFTRFHTVQIHRLPKLERLTIQEHSTTMELGLSQVPALRSCSFWAAEIQADVLTGLLAIPTLTELDVSNTPLQDDAALIISQMSQLRRLSASRHFSRHGLNYLRRLQKLRDLKLYREGDADWTDEDAAEIFKGGPDVTVFP